MTKALSRPLAGGCGHETRCTRGCRVHSSLRGPASRDPRAFASKLPANCEKPSRAVCGVIEIVPLVSSEVCVCGRERRRSRIGRDWTRESEKVCGRGYRGVIIRYLISSLVAHTYAIVLQYPAKGFPRSIHPFIHSLTRFRSLARLLACLPACLLACLLGHYCLPACCHIILDTTACAHQLRHTDTDTRTPLSSSPRSFLQPPPTNKEDTIHAAAYLLYHHTHTLRTSPRAPLTITTTNR